MSDLLAWRKDPTMEDPSELESLRLIAAAAVQKYQTSQQFRYDVICKWSGAVYHS